MESDQANKKNLKYLNTNFGVYCTFCSPWSSYDEVVYDAVNSNNLELLKIVVERFGASVSDNNNDAIIVASNAGYINIVKYLVTHGADPFARNNYIIKNCQNLSIVKFLVEKCRANAHIYDNYAIRQAYLYRNYELCKYFIETCGVPIKYISGNILKYIIFCEKMEEKIRDRAQKKIYFWWIPICYNLSNASGKRMAHKSLNTFKGMMNNDTISCN